MAQREALMVGCGGKGASTNRDDAPGGAPCDAADKARLRPGPGAAAAGALRLGPARAVARGGKRVPRIVESVIGESGHIFIGTAGNLG